MKTSAKTEYACLAMIELAARYGSGEPVRIRHIAAEHDIPQRFLVQILLQLKGAGLVVSTRGAAGGYRLIKPPTDVSLGQVMRIIEGPYEPELAGNATADSAAAKVLLVAWQRASEAEYAVLDDITFADLVELAHEQSEHMYYI